MPMMLVSRVVPVPSEFIMKISVSSPVVWGDRVFVVTSVSSDPKSEFYGQFPCPQLHTDWQGFDFWKIGNCSEQKALQFQSPTTQQQPPQEPAQIQLKSGPSEMKLYFPLPIYHLSS